MSDVFSWLERAYLLTWVLYKWYCLSLKVSYLEAPMAQLASTGDANFDYPAKGLSNFYAIEFYFFLIYIQSLSVLHTDTSILHDVQTYMSF